MAKKAAYMGMLTALAFVFSYIESLLPINLGIPGVKLGLANLVVIVALYTMGVRAAFTLSLVRMENTSLAYYLPALVLSGTAAGVLVGILAAVLVKRLKKGIGGY